MTIEQINLLLTILPLLADDVAQVIIKLMSRAGMSPEQMLDEAAKVNADTLTFIDDQLKKAGIILAD